MSNKLLTITIKGEYKTWSFLFYGNPKYIDEWLNDGLTVNLIENVIPNWVVEYRLVGVYVFLQDFFNFKNPFKK